MQYRYAEEIFPTVVDYFKYKPQILRLFLDEDAVTEDCYSKEVYVCFIIVHNQAARQRIKYALYCEQLCSREIADEIISAMERCDWELKFRLSKAERDKILLTKSSIYVVYMVLAVVTNGAFIYTHNKFSPVLSEVGNTITLFIMFITNSIIYISISEFYKFIKEKRKARRNEGLAILKAKNRSMFSKKSIANNSSPKTMPENTQGSKYNFPNAKNVNIYEKVRDVINYNTPDSRQSIEDAREFLQMLEQVCPDYLTLAEAQQQAIVSTTIEQFKHDKSTTWQRLHRAGRTLLIESFKEVLGIPAVNVIVETIKSYRDPE